MNEEELFRKYRETGDIAIRNQIVEKYLYIASVLAKKFVGRGVEYDDLYQVASLALIKGVERFDERKGLKFSTFITPTITGEIKNYFRDRSRLVHLPRKVSELRVSIKREAEKFLAETGRNATAKELAARLGVSEEDVFEDVENRAAVHAALKNLSEEERKLVRYRFGEELSQMETAKRMGVSQMNVSRMERKILQKLKDNLKKTMVE